MRKLLTTLLFLVGCLGAQDFGVDTTFTASPNINDSTTMLDILRDDTVSASSDPLVYEIETKDSVFIFDKGISISVAWSFGSSEMVGSWKQAQERYQKDVEDIFDSIVDSTSHLQLVSLEQPTNQAISFPLSVGYLFRLSNRLAIHSVASYGYQGKKTSFLLNEYITSPPDSSGRTFVTDTIEVYRYKTHLQHHLVSVGAQVEYLIVPDYFSVDRVARVGVTAGAQYIPLSLYLSNTENQSPEKNFTTSKYVSAKGMGVGWDFAVFGEKELSKNSAGRLTVGYTGSYSTGFEGYEDLSQSTPSADGSFPPPRTQTTSDALHMFKLNFTLLVGSKKGVEADDE